MESSLRLDPSMTARDVYHFMHTSYNVDLSCLQGWKFKELGLQLIDGNVNETYKLLPWMCERLRDADPETIVICEANDDSTFCRMFITYGCSVIGFWNGCRPIIFIDASYLSGPFKGTLLGASSLDANNKLYPLAYAVVSGETYDNWLWFLDTLKKEILRYIPVVIVSNKHNAILQSVPHVFCKDRHVFCYRHIKENFILKVNKAKQNRQQKCALELLDGVTYARLERDYISAMENLRAFCLQLATWVEENELERWVISKFSHMQQDKITTNLVESFNAWFKKERCLPTLSFLNKHHEKLATKLNKVNTEMVKWKSIVGGNIEDILMKNTRIRDLFLFCIAVRNDIL